MVNFSVEQVLCQLIRIALDGIYIVVQIYHVRMYGPICSRCTYLCLSILLCICPVQLDYEVAFTIRSTNGFFLPKQAVETCWSIFNQSKSTYKTTLVSHNYGKWWRKVINVWSVLKMQLILSESQKSMWQLSWRGITLHIVYFGLQKHLNGQYFISSRFSSNEVRCICVNRLYGRVFISCSCSGQTAEAAVLCIESGPFKYCLCLSALWSCAIKKWNVIL